MPSTFLPNAFIPSAFTTSFTLTLILSNNGDPGNTGSFGEISISSAVCGTPGNIPIGFGVGIKKSYKVLDLEDKEEDDKDNNKEEEDEEEKDKEAEVEAIMVIVFAKGIKGKRPAFAETTRRSKRIKYT